MADIPSVRPTAPTTPVTGNNTPQLSNAPVQQAPATVTTPVQLTGTVVSSNPQTQQLNIQTQQGLIVVQSTASLPPNTPVTIELYTVNAQMRATVTVMQQNIAQQTQAQVQTLENAIQPNAQPAATPPSLQEGDTVTALQLPQQPAAQTAAAQVESTGLQNVQPPLSPQQLQEVLTTPDTLRQLLSAYMPQKTSDETAVPATAGNTTPDIPDDNLLQIMQAQLQAKTTQENIQSPPAPGNTKQAAFSPLTTTLDALISSSGETSQKTSGFSELLRQLIPQNIQESTPAPQNMFQLHILKILPPATTLAQITAAMQKMPASAQTGEIETTTSGGQPILQTADEHFVVSTPVTVPTGSKIIFEATPMTPKQIVQTGLFSLPESGAPQSSTWPALQQALQTLQPAGPQAAAAQSLRNTLPTPTPQLAPAALFFLAALRSGSISNWLGANTLQALQQVGQKQLAASLSSDFDKLAAQSKDMLPGDWRSVSIPIRYDEQISQMQFYVRQQHDQERQGNDQTSGKPATRFILNLSLSRMGPVQLDGFIQKKNFDIILRTEDRLPLDMRQELMKRFAQGLDQVQMQGGISFQTRQQGWMVPEAGNTIAEA